MKKIIFITGLMLFTLIQAKAQQEKQEIASTRYTLHNSNADKDNLYFNFLHNAGPQTPGKDYEYYKRKKRNNLTAGLVTLGGGLVLSGVGLITAINTTSYNNSETAGILLIAGAASGIASIPLMIMATVYGQKAKLEISNQKTGFGVPANVSKDITGITLTIPIRK